MCGKPFCLAACIACLGLAALCVCESELDFEGFFLDLEGFGVGGELVDAVAQGGDKGLDVGVLDGDGGAGGGEDVIAGGLQESAAVAAGVAAEGERAEDDTGDGSCDEDGDVESLDVGGEGCDERDEERDGDSEVDGDA